MILSCLRNTKEKETLAWRQQCDWFRWQYLGLYRKLLALEALRLYTLLRGFWINRGSNISGRKKRIRTSYSIADKKCVLFLQFFHEA